MLVPTFSTAQEGDGAETLRGKHHLNDLFYSCGLVLMCGLRSVATSRNPCRLSAQKASGRLI